MIDKDYFIKQHNTYMTMQDYKDEFLQLRRDDEVFAGLYDDTLEDFQDWLHDQGITL
jgi:hypothetical protein